MHDLHCSGTGVVLTGTPGGLGLDGHLLGGDGTGTALRLAAPAPDADVVLLTGGRLAGWEVGVAVDEPGGRPWVDVHDVEVDDVGTLVRAGVPVGAEVHGATVRGADVVLDLAATSVGRLDSVLLERNDVVIAPTAGSEYRILQSDLVDDDVVVAPGPGGHVELRDVDVRGSTTVVGAGEWGSFGVSGSTFVDNDVAVAGGVVPGSVVDNVFEGNRLALTATPQTGSAWDGTLRVVGNTFRGNVDAIDVPEEADVEIGGNTVRDNRGWGIRAPGATDLGGNRAWGNGNEPQCTGVVCAGPPS